MYQQFIAIPQYNSYKSYDCKELPWGSLIIQSKENKAHLSLPPSFNQITILVIDYS